MTSQTHENVLDLYHALGITGIERVNTSLSNGQINGCFLSETATNEYSYEEEIEAFPLSET